MYVNRIAPGPDGNVWFTANTPNGGEIGRVTPAGKLTQFAVTASPGGITAGPDNNLWFTMNGQIGRITTSGTVSLFDIGSGYSARDIALGPDGNLWFTIPSSTGFVGRITPVGTVSAFATPTQYSSPAVLTPGADGAVWFTELNTRPHGAIARVASDGTITEYPPPNLNVNNAQFGIAAGPDGNIWTAAYYGFVIGQFGIAPPTSCQAVTSSVNPPTVAGGARETITTVMNNCASVPKQLKLVSKTTPPVSCGSATSSNVTVPLAPHTGTTEVSSFTAPSCAGTYKVKETLMDGSTAVGSATLTYQVT